MAPETVPIHCNWVVFHPQHIPQPSRDPFFHCSLRPKCQEMATFPAACQSWKSVRLIFTAVGCSICTCNTQEAKAQIRIAESELELETENHVHTIK